MLSFTLLGQVTIAKAGIPLSQFRSQKQAALLVYLAHTGQSHQRPFLADLLWESRSTKQSLTNLRTLLSRLRKQVGGALTITRQAVTLTDEHLQQVDSVRLLQTLNEVMQVDSAETATQLQTALQMYEGEFLAGFDLDEAPQFDEWLQVTREHIRRQVIAGYSKLSQYLLATHEYEGGLSATRAWLQIDALDEMAHTLVLQFLLGAGHKREALEHYAYCSELLQRELGVHPPAEMTALVDALRPKRPFTPTLPSPTRHNLPLPHDQFFGRKTVQQEIHTRLDQPWCRLVTLVGQGGVGKTRLATAVARHRLKQYADGVWFVELADIDPDDEDVAEAIAVEIATILTLRLTGSRSPIEQLVGHLQHKRMLLILDNFEHVLEGADLVLQIVQQCEQVQLLATSREPLQIRAEWTIALKGLNYPADEMTGISSEAVDLFLARRAQQQHGGVSAEALTAVQAICRLVEGLPLAIELSAALMRTASAQEVLQQLQDGFDALVTSMRDVPARHRSLHIVFEMSWRTLTPVLQQCLARLALFRGGCTQTAVNHITHALPQHLTALIEKSLLSYDAQRDRYLLHPIIRAYAEEKRPLTDPTLDRHARYYLTLLAQNKELLQKDKPQEIINRLIPDIDNIRLAWQTGLTQQQADMLEDALPSLSIYYQLRGLSHEGQTVMHNTVKTAKAWATALMIQAGLEQARFQNRLGQYPPAIQTLKVVVKQAEQTADDTAKAMGYVLWGEALWRLGEYDSAENKLTHALRIAQAVENTTIIGWCHHHLGIINDIQSQYAIAHDYLQQACTAWRTLDNIQALSGSLNSIGLVCYHQGDLLAAQEAMEQALTLCEQVGDYHRQANMINNLSIIATERQDYMGAEYYLQLGLKLAKSTGDLPGQGAMYINLGKTVSLREQYEFAIEYLTKGLDILQSIGDRSMEAEATITLAEVNFKQTHFTQAGTLYNQALQIAREHNLQRAECEALIGMVRTLYMTRPAKARDYSLEAVTLAEEIKNPHLIERAKATYYEIFG